MTNNEIQYGKLYSDDKGFTVKPLRTEALTIEDDLVSNTLDVLVCEITSAPHKGRFINLYLDEFFRYFVLVT